MKPRQVLLRDSDQLKSINGEGTLTLNGNDHLCSDLHRTIISPMNGAIIELQNIIRGQNTTKGWESPIPTGLEIAVKIALVGTEAGEMLDAFRNEPVKMSAKCPALTEVEEEAADVGIRFLSLCDTLGIDLARCMLHKMAYNETRPYKHGGKKF